MACMNHNFTSDAASAALGPVCFVTPAGSGPQGRPRIGGSSPGVGGLPGQTGVRARLASLASRLMDAAGRRRQRQVDREFARLLARSGGRLTDSQEREIMRRAFASDWSLPQ